MKMWIVEFAEEGNYKRNYEYYTNEEAAKTSGKYFENRFFRVWVYEEEIMDKPREGAPKGFYMWDGVVVK